MWRRETPDSVASNYTAPDRLGAADALTVFCCALRVAFTPDGTLAFVACDSENPSEVAVIDYGSHQLHL